MDRLASRLIDATLEAGFTAAGIAPAVPGAHIEEYLTWLEQNYHAEQSYLARDDYIARRKDLSLVLPGVKSILVAAWEYHGITRDTPVPDRKQGIISCYAQGEDYHTLIARKLHRIVDDFRHTNHIDLQARVYVDTGPIMERDHAVQAGLGFIGKNCNLIVPSRGSYVFLGVVFLDIELHSAEPAQMPSCGTCTRCIDACPTGALISPYVLDSTRCISYLTTAHKGLMPLESRPLVGNHVFGCDICQKVCPYNRFCQKVDVQAPSLAELLCTTPEHFKTRYRNSAVAFIRYPRFMRNVVVAAGNSQDPDLEQPLITLLDQTEPVIRAHAAWALGQLSTPNAINAINSLAEYESDQMVIDEIKRVTPN